VLCQLSIDPADPQVISVNHFHAERSPGHASVSFNRTQGRREATGSHLRDDGETDHSIANHAEVSSARLGRC
jgi:hypothetical protein